MKKNLITTLLILFAMFTVTSSYAQDTGKSKDTGTDIKPALLVIDIQNAYLAMVPEREKEVGMYYINALIELFRAKGYPVITVYHYSKEYGPEQGTEQFEFPASVSVTPGDPKIIKTYGDGFNNTALDSVIQASGSNTLFLCGLSAVGCVLATWVGAQNHDYKAFMVKDAIMSHNSDYTNQVEVIFDAVSYDIVKLLLESAKK